MTHNSVVMGSPWGTNIHIGQVSVDHCYGQSRPKVGEVRTTGNPRRNKTLANSERVFANDSRYAEVYPTIAGCPEHASDSCQQHRLAQGSLHGPFL